MNKGELIEAVAKGADLSKKGAGDAVDAVLASIQKALKKGDKVVLIGFGTFSVTRHAARMGINPQTKEKIKISARKAVKFKAGAGLKKAL